MSPARSRLGSVRAVAERLLRGAPRRSPEEVLVDALTAAVPGVRSAVLRLAPAVPVVEYVEGDEPWLEPDRDDSDAAVLDRIGLRLDPALFSSDEVAIPGPRLADALRALGWTEETGLDGAVRDDVDAVTLYAPGAGSTDAYRALWDIAVPVAREALLAGTAPGTLVPLSLTA